jgi:prephenate dehydrogenase
MSAEKPRISIVGLGLIGGSIGLALRQAEVAAAVIGHDRDRSASNEAKRKGAVDQIHWNLVSACEEADLVVLATPVGAIEDTMKAIGPYLRPGCVVMDTCSVKSPVMGWAADNLPEQVYFVGGNPILGMTPAAPGGLEAARADLFQNGVFCLVPSPKADEASVRLVTDLATILGAKPLFLDAAEHDGLLAAVEHLPFIVALAMLETATGQPTWRELRKMAGPAFDSGTQLVAPDSVAHSDLYLLNRDNLVRWIDTLSASLGSIREMLAEDQEEAFAARLKAALQERQKWLADRAQGQWYEGPRTEMPEKPSLMDTFFGTFWRRKPKEQS